ncbi:MAG: DUF1343 domain-containing protein [Alphaproteobacteria bacterium]|nr:DUF1343 domain-containing protein [Alphaproteobacteria bacterium]MCB9794437.1 DUF1343 domain-containing protein [Alphaproteobacteria bacterium]
MKTGLDRLLENPGRLKGLRFGVCCNPTAVDRDLVHIVDALRARGLSPARLFGPEHGVTATAQDMIEVDYEGPSVVSLYGDSEASLRPPVETLADLDLLVFDIQDIGSRYYTYQATLGYVMEVAAQAGTKVLVLDRPNPIDGVSLEGNVVAPGFESFVSAYPLANRHGMTMGEMGVFFRDVLGIGADLEVLGCEGWRREQYFDETGLPWVFPSPNMPTLETAILYPGMCLIEGTNLSEGRGTTRPFHLVGAPWLDPGAFADMLRKEADDSGLSGVAFRPASFWPQFQKHAGQVCNGVEIHLLDRHALEPLLLGFVVLAAARRCDPERFAWRTETYEFVDEPIAIDLLCGSAEARLALEAGLRPRDLVEGWKPELEEFMEARESCLLYP